MTRIDYGEAVDGGRITPTPTANTPLDSNVTRLTTKNPSGDPLMRRLFGYALQFLGLGLVALAMLTATDFPTTPLWVFLLLGLAAGAPPISIGARLVHRSRFPAQESDEAVAKDYRRQTRQMAIVMVWLWGLSLLVTVPLIVWREWFLAHPARFWGWFGSWFLLMLTTRPWLRRALFTSSDG